MTLNKEEFQKWLDDMDFMIGPFFAELPDSVRPRLDYSRNQTTRVRCAPRLLILGLCLITGCAGPAATVPMADTIADPIRPDIQAFARPLERHICTAALVSHSRTHATAQPMVRATCRRPPVTLARNPTNPRRRATRSATRPRYLRALLSGGRSPVGVSDREIRATDEYRSLMDPRNRWQWRDRVTAAEALAMCRAMLADLHRLRRVDWDTHARHYLARVRRQQARARSPVPRNTGQRGARPGYRPGDRPDERLDDRAPSPRADDTPDRPERPDSSDPTPGPGPRPEIDAVGQPDGPPVSAPVAIDVDRLLDRSWQLRHEARLRRQQSGQRASAWTALAQRLDQTEAHLGALTTLLAGVPIVIAGVVIHGAATDVTIAATGELAGDPDLNLRLARPALEALADDLHALGDLEEALGAPAGTYQSPLDQAQQDAYRRLLRTPTSSLNALDLEQLDRLHERTGDTGELSPGSRLHKARRWRTYRERAGTWRFERWSKTYDQNMTRPREAHARADRLRDQLGWGQRELRVDMPDGGVRVLDIGDKNISRAIEVKRGYVKLDADTAMQLRKDAVLVNAKNWSITWHVDGRCSQPVRDALREAGIELIELRADTPIKNL